MGFALLHPVRVDRGIAAAIAAAHENLRAPLRLIFSNAGMAVRFSAAMNPDPIDQAFAHVLSSNRAALMRIARRYAGPQDWQDLLQEIHLQLWRSYQGFAGRAQLATWVYRVALNTALSQCRKPRRVHQPLEQVAETGDAGVPGDPMHVLEEFLAELDPLQRSVLVLDLEGLGREQIADVLGLSPAAIAVRMTRLRQTLESKILEKN